MFLRYRGPNISPTVKVCVPVPIPNICQCYFKYPHAEGIGSSFSTSEQYLSPDVFRKRASDDLQREDDRGDVLGNY